MTHACPAYNQFHAVFLSLQSAWSYKLEKTYVFLTYCVCVYLHVCFSFGICYTTVDLFIYLFIFGKHLLITNYLRWWKIINS